MTGELKFKDFKDFCEVYDIQYRVPITHQQIEFLNKLFDKYTVYEVSPPNIIFNIQKHTFTINYMYITEKEITLYNSIEKFLKTPNKRLLDLLQIKDLKIDQSFYIKALSMTKEQLNIIIDILEFMSAQKRFFINHITPVIFECRINFHMGSFEFNINLNCIEETISYYKIIEPTIKQLILLQVLEVM